MHSACWLLSSWMKPNGLRPAWQHAQTLATTDVNRRALHTLSPHLSPSPPSSAAVAAVSLHANLSDCHSCL